MKVWLAKRYFRHNNDAPIGVFSSKEGALTACRQHHSKTTNDSDLTFTTLADDSDYSQDIEGTYFYGVFWVEVQE